MNRYGKHESWGRRCGIFIDIHNMFITAKENFQSKIDYQSLLPELASNRDVIVARAYCLIKDKERSGSFEEALKKAGYDVITKDMEFKQPRTNGTPWNNGQQNRPPRQRNVATWDIGISMDMLSFCPKLDVIILVAGGNVFIDAVKRLKQNNVRVEIAGFGGHTSGRLIEAADDFIDLKPNNKPDPEWLKKFEFGNEVPEEEEETQPFLATK